LFSAVLSRDVLEGIQLPEATDTTLATSRLSVLTIRMFGHQAGKLGRLPWWCRQGRNYRA
jgi:hypothetical protein